MSFFVAVAVVVVVFVVRVNPLVEKGRWRNKFNHKIYIMANTPKE